MKQPKERPARRPLKTRLKESLRHRTGLFLTYDQTVEFQKMLGGMASKESSPELSSLAGKLLTTDRTAMRMRSKRGEALLNQFVEDAVRLAGSVLSQDETEGQSDAPDA